jgi:hypothetical protein
MISAVLLSEASSKVATIVTSFLHVDGAVRSFTTNTLATQGVFTNASSIIPFQINRFVRDIHRLK